MKKQHNYFFISCSAILLLLSSCSGNRKPDDPFNATASLPPAFNFSQKGFKVLTSFFNRKTGSVSMLFGNAKAKQEAMEGSLPVAGAEWALVTWKTVADKHWFGADIPGELLYLETVKADSVQSGPAQMKYTRYTGKDLAADQPAAPDPERIREILALRPAIMP